MKSLPLFYLVICCLILPPNLLGQNTEKPEFQISFTKENKPLEYYVKQAELWWKEIEKNQKAQYSWYNYYRACRSAQALANWQSEFVEKTPYLRFGDDIVKLIEKHIPDTFVYNFVKGSTAGVSPEAGEYLVKAYAENPDFEGLLATMVTYSTSTHNLKLRQEVNQRWFRNNGLPKDLLTLGHNLLHSVDSDAILLTEHDNDTYPLWMLQEAKSIREDVLVINIDFLLYEGYRKKIFADLKIPPFTLEHIDIDEYEHNWKNIVKHFLVKYQGKRPVYISKTMDPKRYEGFEAQLHLSGITLRFEKQGKSDLGEKNLNLLENVYLLDYLKMQLNHDPMQARIDEMNLVYLQLLEYALTAYRENQQDSKIKQVKKLANSIINRAKDNPNAKKYRTVFE